MPSTTTKAPVSANGITYRWPKKPVVVVCIDGGDPAYFQQFLADGVIPILQKRGLYRTDYEGPTLRDHFGFPRPPNLHRSAAQGRASASG